MKARTRKFNGDLTEQCKQKGNVFCMAEERGQFQYATGRELVLKPERQKRLQQSRLRKAKA